MGRKQNKFENKYNGLKQRSPNSIQISFTYQDKQRREPISNINTTDEKIWQGLALDLEQIKYEIRTGEFDYSRTFPDSPRAKLFAPTRGALLKTYLPYFMKIRRQGIQKMGKKPLRDSTFHTNILLIEQILIPAFGDLCIDQINADHVYDWAEKYRNGRTTKTLKNILSPLRVALDYAVIQRLIQTNPIKTLTVFGDKRTQKADKHDPFTKDEIETILLNCSGQLHNYIRFAIFTGLRPSEQIALGWDDYDPIAKTLNVDKAITDLSDNPEIGGKTFCSERIIKLSPTAIHALECQKIHTHSIGKYIFHNPPNRYNDHSSRPWQGSKELAKQYKTILKNAGVRYRKPYSTRHTYASMQISAGENLAFMSKQLGHESIAFTLKTYASWIANSDPDAGNKADKLFTDLSTKYISENLTLLR